MIIILTIVDIVFHIQISINLMIAFQIDLNKNEKYK